MNHTPTFASLSAVNGWGLILFAKEAKIEPAKLMLVKRKFELFNGWDSTATGLLLITGTKCTLVDVVLRSSQLPPDDGPSNYCRLEVLPVGSCTFSMRNNRE